MIYNNIHQTLTHFQSKLVSREVTETLWLQLIVRMPELLSFTSRQVSKIVMTHTNPCLLKKARDTTKLSRVIIQAAKTMPWGYHIQSSKDSRGSLMSKSSKVKVESRKWVRDLEALFLLWDKIQVNKFKSRREYKGMILKNKFSAFTPYNLINLDLIRLLWAHIVIKKQLVKNLIKRKNNRWHRLTMISYLIKKLIEEVQNKWILFNI